MPCGNLKKLINSFSEYKIKKFGQYGDHYGEFKYPAYTVTDGNRIFVSDAYNYRIQIFNITP